MEFWVEGKSLLSYTDAHPIDGGVPAIWSTDNGISVALAQLHFAQPAQPRTEAQVLLDTPWYPEWTNVNTPLTLDFPKTWSTSGKPVSLHVKKQLAPEGEDGAVTVQEKRITYTPKQIGEYWYEISASDGSAQSAPFHLFGQTFNPALGRDDAHAVVLYRFTEGSGAIVHDQSKIAPPADLNLPTDKDAAGTPSWLPGQGLTIRGANPLMTAHGVPKLLALAKAHAGTLEFWVSTDTLYPATGWSGCLLAWEVKPEQRNFAVGHLSSTLAFAPRNTPIAGNNGNVFQIDGFRTCLQHYVLTWDGTTTRWYVNGKSAGTKTVDWTVDNWSPDALLLLGNQLEPAAQLSRHLLSGGHSRPLLHRRRGAA